MANQQILGFKIQGLIMTKMHKQVLAAAFFLLCLLLPLKTLAATFSGMYVFGDSVSDTGNLFTATQGTIEETPSREFYFNGRFSNGPIWVDYLSQNLGLSSPTPFLQALGGAVPSSGINFAFGGATTGISGTDPRIPGLQQQIGLFASSLGMSPIADPNALYLVWAGSNDYRPDENFTPFTQPDIPLANLSNAVTSLVGLGAKNIMVVNLPNLGDLPLTRGTPQGAFLNGLTQAHNVGLAQGLNALSQQLGSSTNLMYLDVNSLFTRIAANPGEFGLTNAIAPCYNPFSGDVCNNPNDYLLWDLSHPTTATHKLIGDYAFSVLQPPPPASVPEPASGLGILAFGALGAASVLKRRG